MDETMRVALAHLEEIANILGIPVDQFMNGFIPNDLLATDECFRLWSRLKTEHGRQRALDALRRMVDEEAASTKSHG